MRKRALWIGTCGLLVFAGCSDDSPPPFADGGMQHDADFADSADDVNAQDAARSDANARDAALADVAPADVALADVTLPDVARPLDAGAPDAGAAAVYPSDFGELGVGNDTAILNEAYMAAVEQDKPLDLGGHTYVLTPNRVVNVFGRDTYFAIEILSNTRIIGHDATIQLVDNFSTDAAPKQLALFLTDADTENFYIEDVTFDLNGRNNPISPDRDRTDSDGHLLPLRERYHSWISDGLAWVKSRVEHLEIIRCNFINGAGNTSILVSWSIPRDAHLSNDVLIQDCVFRNNGFDVFDYSAINTYADNTIVEGCTFQEPHSVSLPTAFDSHGTNAIFRNNRVTGGFGRAVIAGTNGSGSASEHARRA